MSGQQLNRDVDETFVASARAIVVTGTHFSRENTEAAQRKAIRIAKANQATPAQMALAFLLERDGVFVIPKTSNIERARENRDCISLDISDEDWEALDAAFPPPAKKTPLEML